MLPAALTIKTLKVWRYLKYTSSCLFSELWKHISNSHGLYLKWQLVYNIGSEIIAVKVCHKNENPLGGLPKRIDRHIPCADVF